MSTVITTAPPRWREAARRLGAAGATMALATAGLIGLSEAAHANEVTETFSSPNGTSWTVPPGVRTLDVEVVGASGGGGDTLEIPIIGVPLTGDGTGGVGHLVRATLDVTPGEVIQFFGSTEGGPVGDRHEPGHGGTGYRTGGDGNTGSLLGKAGGGGGGASAVVATDRLIVAAGGGGGAGRGAGFASCYGGHGGNAQSAGWDGYGVCAGAGDGGNTGTVSGGDGSNGGNAGGTSSGGGGGGGGGGHLGGSGGSGSSVGGAGGGGGGGGSSYVSAEVSAQTPVLRDTWGGGYVRITYDPSYETNTTLDADPEESVYGQGATYTATVTNSDTSDVPTGTVHLLHGDQLLGTAPAADGQAVFSGVRLDVGSAQVRAEFHPATADFQPSTGYVDVTVGPGQTTTTLQVQPQGAVVGQTVTATAQVQPVSPASGTVDAAVQFTRDGQELGTAEVLDGVATLEFAVGGSGTEDIVAGYLGSERFGPSVAVARTVNVDRGQTTTEVLSAPNPSVRGQEVELEAQVQVQDPAVAELNGTVQFYVDDEPVGEPQQADEDGIAVLTTAELLVGAHQVSATYSGDEDLYPSTSEGYLHAVERADAQIVLDADPDSSRYGEVIELSAQLEVLEPGAATVSGSVEFFAGDISLGTSEVTTSVPQSLDTPLPASEVIALAVPRSEGSAMLQVADLGIGEHVLTAVYSGNDDVNTATSAEVEIAVEIADVTVTVTTDPDASVWGQQVELTAAVAPDHDSELLPTGQVQFEVDGAQVGAPVSLVDGVATLEVDDLAVGDREIVASYLGDDGHVAALSQAHDHGVGQGQTSTTLTLSATEVQTDEGLTLTGLVEVLDPARGEPTGTVQFLLDGEPVGEPVELNSTATLEVDGLEVGSYVLQAEYSGDENFVTSASDEQTLSVVEAPAGGSAGSSGSGLPRTGLAALAALVTLAALLTVAGAGMVRRQQAR